MNEFPSGPGFSKALAPIGQPCVISVGYNNFAYIEPLKKPWVQKYYTLHFVLHGSGFLEMHGKKHPVFSQQFFITPPNELKLYYPNHNDKWDYIWFCVDGSGADKLFEGISLSTDKPVLQTKHGAHITAALASLFIDGKFADDYRIISVFYEILHCISLPHSHGSSELKAIIDRSFYSTDFTIEKLCKDFGISHAQLCRVFLKEYGIQPKQYLISQRINYAKELLIQTDLKLDIVARSCGYNDPVHFMKEFKSRVGVSAGLFRKAR